MSAGVVDSGLAFSDDLTASSSSDSSASLDTSPGSVRAVLGDSSPQLLDSEEEEGEEEEEEEEEEREEEVEGDSSGSEAPPAPPPLPKAFCVARDFFGNRGRGGQRHRKANVRLTVDQQQKQSKHASHRPVFTSEEEEGAEQWRNKRRKRSPSPPPVKIFTRTVQRPPCKEPKSSSSRRTTKGDGAQKAQTCSNDTPPSEEVLSPEASAQLQAMAMVIKPAGQRRKRGSRRKVKRPCILTEMRAVRSYMDKVWPLWSSLTTHLHQPHSAPHHAPCLQVHPPWLCDEMTRLFDHDLQDGNEDWCDCALRSGTQSHLQLLNSVGGATAPVFIAFPKLLAKDCVPLDFTDSKAESSVGKGAVSVSQEVQTDAVHPVPPRAPQHQVQTDYHDALHLGGSASPISAASAAIFISAPAAVTPRVELPVHNYVYHNPYSLQQSQIQHIHPMQLQQQRPQQDQQDQQLRVNGTKMQSSAASGSNCANGLNGMQLLAQAQCVTSTPRSCGLIMWESFATSSQRAPQQFPMLQHQTLQRPPQQQQQPVQPTGSFPKTYASAAQKPNVVQTQQQQQQQMQQQQFQKNPLQFLPGNHSSQTTCAPVVQIQPQQTQLLQVVHQLQRAQQVQQVQSAQVLLLTQQLQRVQQQSQFPQLQRLTQQLAQLSVTSAAQQQQRHQPVAASTDASAPAQQPYRYASAPASASTATNSAPPQLQGVQGAATHFQAGSLQSQVYGQGAVMVHLQQLTQPPPPLGVPMDSSSNHVYSLWQTTL